MFDNLNSLLPKMPQTLSEVQLSAIKLGLDEGEPTKYEDDVKIYAAEYFNPNEGDAEVAYNTAH